MKKSKIKYILISVGMFVIVCIGMFFTFSYLTGQSNDVKNIFTVGKVSLELLEMQTCSGLSVVYSKEGTITYVDKKMPIFSNSIVDGKSIYYLKKIDYIDGYKMRVRYAGTGYDDEKKATYESTFTIEPPSFPDQTDGYEVCRVTKNDEYGILPGVEYWKDPTVYIHEGSEPCYVFIKVDNPFSGLEDGGSFSIQDQIKQNDWMDFKDADGNKIAGVYYYSQEGKKEVDASTEEKVLPIFTHFVLRKDPWQNGSRGNLVDFKPFRIEVGAIACAGGIDIETAYKMLYAAKFNN